MLTFKKRYGDYGELNFLIFLSCFSVRCWQPCTLTYENGRRLNKVFTLFCLCLVISIGAIQFNSTLVSNVPENTPVLNSIESFEVIL
ncbi:hypothetical protein OUZ56_000342 [Daphnia magna]|uniref:Uncharacterized protein n=1 Tax=Daphnia magna TaxID=35525 RepID=A0ABQ9ZZL6_9CRUS|nr:hypothetical protein OUZ56_000342 [Daphnia magna]